MERLHYNSYVDEALGIFIERSDGSVEWSPCWLWLGNVDRFGYGRMAIWSRGVRQARNYAAHRVSFFAHKGLKYKARRPLLMHQCDRRPCIHPDHVDPGTHLKNMAEMVQRGRHGNMHGNVSNNYGREPVQSREPGEDDE